MYRLVKPANDRRAQLGSTLEVTTVTLLCRGRWPCGVCFDVCREALRVGDFEENADCVEGAGCSGVRC